MKKRVVTLLLVAAMTGSMVVGCGSNSSSDTKSETKTESTDTKTEEKKELADDEYQYVSAEDTAKADGVHVLDVREWDNYVTGRVKNSEWCPIFPLEDDSLVDAMTDYAKENLNDGKDIYIICNSGKRGAEKATGVLRDAGIESTSIYTVEGGAKALADVSGALTTNRTEENIDWQYVSGKDAVAAVESGKMIASDFQNAEGQITGALETAVKCVNNEDYEKELWIPFEMITPDNYKDYQSKY